MALANCTKEEYGVRDERPLFVHFCHESTCVYAGFKFVVFLFLGLCWFQRQASQLEVGPDSRKEKS